MCIDKLAHHAGVWLSEKTLHTSIADEIIRHAERYESKAPLLSQTIALIADKRIPVVIASPHFDDAACSAGGLIATLAKETDVIVANAFTDGPDHDTRLAEEYNAMEKLGNNISVIDFRFPDMIGPDVGSSRLNENDRLLVQLLQAELKQRFGENDQALFIGPLGAKNKTHKHHIILRESLRQFCRGRVIYWQDYPYSRWQRKADQDYEFIAKYSLSPIIFREGQSERRAAIVCHKSQLASLFLKGSVPGTKDLVPEIYYLDSRVVQVLLAG